MESESRVEPLKRNEGESQGGGTGIVCSKGSEQRSAENTQVADKRTEQPAEKTHGAGDNGRCGTSDKPSIESSQVVDPVDEKRYSNLTRYRGKSEAKYVLSNLYRLCIKSFTPTLSDKSLLCPNHIKYVVNLVAKLKAEHFGLKNAAMARGIGYLHLVEEECFSAGIFVLSPGAVIPLHDHPKMCVVSNVLQGAVHIRSFDWVDPSADHSNGGVAKLVCDQTFRSPCTRVLYPESGGNIHTFRADKKEGCIILDVLAPPYSDDHGRSCSYYSLISHFAENEENQQTHRLSVCDPGIDFEITGIPYNGPSMMP